jgi:histidine triad (HIT) family protein
MDECLFCRISEGEIPADIVEANDEFLAFRDINPQAPVHVLIVPRRHIRDIASLAEIDPGAAGRMLGMAGLLASELGLAENGYRLVFNTGVDGGQSVDHVHLHLLGRRQLMWPPG